MNCKFCTLDVNNITKTNDERMFAEMFFTDSAVKVMKEVCVVLTATCIDWFLFCLHFTFFLVCIFALTKFTFTNLAV